MTSRPVRVGSVVLCFPCSPPPSFALMTSFLSRLPPRTHILFFFNKNSSTQYLYLSTLSDVLFSSWEVVFPASGLPGSIMSSSQFLLMCEVTFLRMNNRCSPGRLVNRFVWFCFQSAHLNRNKTAHIEAAACRFSRPRPA